MRPLLKTDAKRRFLMQRVRQKGTSVERIVADACRSLGLRYRLNVRSLPGSPDLANKSQRWAIFVNGCFWHNHKHCRLGSIPSRNAQFWQRKFADNRKRDALKIRQLRQLGFRVVIVWQCQAKTAEGLADRLSKLSEPR